MSQDNIQPELAYDMSWMPEVPAQSKTISELMLDEAFDERYREMLEDYDNLTPELIDGYERPYMHISKTQGLIDKHFGADMSFSIQYQLVGKAPNDDVVTQGTLYVLTDSGYEPLLSRFGIGKNGVNSGKSDGAYADAELSARRALYAAIGLPDSVSEEMDQMFAQEVTRSLESKMKVSSIKLTTLISSYNSSPESEDKRIKVPTNTKEVSDMALDHIKALSDFLTPERLDRLAKK